MKKKRNWLILLALTLLLGRMAFLFQPLLPDDPVSGKAVSQTVSEAAPTLTSDPRIAEAHSLWNAVEDRIQTSETGEITLDVDYLSQEGILPTGCETVSAAMVLNYWQQEILPTDLAEQLPSENIRWDESGKCYGPDPNEVFVGSPFTTWGYGCFAPVIEELIQSVNKVLDEFGIDAPLMIVKGDGSVMSEEMAKIRPVETILSGPASSINGAKKLSGKDNAIVVDIGGTTTDIGIVRDGKPRLDPEGALIGGYRTRVMAAEITTAGMGGDSRIVINGEKVYLSPVRVIPLCVAAWKHPGLRERLQALVDDGPKKIPVAHYARNIVIDTEYFIKVKEMKNADYLTELDEKFLDFVKDEPHSLAEAKRKLKEPPISFNIEKMEELGIIQRIGLTPTDLMHARGCFTKYDAEASKLGIAYHAANLDMTPEEFIAKADYLVTEKIGMEIVKKVLLEDNRETDLTGFGMDLVDKAVTGSHALDYDVSFRLNKPIIGMGGPAYDMLPKVAELLGTELVMPENYDVGNAVGAVSGKVVESIEILIQTATGTTIDNPACTAFSRLGRFYYEKFDDGVVQATEAGKQYVTEMAKKAGAENIKVTVGSDKSEVFVGKEHLRTRFVEIKLIITATGDPAYRKKA